VYHFVWRCSQCVWQCVPLMFDDCYNLFWRLFTTRCWWCLRCFVDNVYHLCLTMCYHFVWRLLTMCFIYVNNVFADFDTAGPRVRETNLKTKSAKTCPNKSLKKQVRTYVRKRSETKMRTYVRKTNLENVRKLIRNKVWTNTYCTYLCCCVYLCLCGFMYMFTCVIYVRTYMFMCYMGVSMLCPYQHHPPENEGTSHNER
jgi:hypothetical protein